MRRRARVAQRTRLAAALAAASFLLTLLALRLGGAAELQVGGVPVDSAGEWREALKELERTPIEIVAGERTFAFSPAALGLRVNMERIEAEAAARRRGSLGTVLLGAWTRRSLVEEIPVPIEWEKDRFEESLTYVRAQLERPSRNARIAAEEGAESLLPGRTGLAVDLAGLEEAVRKAAASRRERRVELTLVPLPPEVDAERLASAAFDHELAVFETRFDPAAEARAANIRLAARAVDGWPLGPGGSFSLNAATGRRTAEAGYREAPVIVDGLVRPGLGGGVSQLSSTLFNAALLAGMEILEHHNHSLPVQYLPLGRDATVWDDQLDLRFRNPWDGLVLLRARVEGDRIIVRLLGEERPFTAVDLTTEIARRIPPPEGVSLPQETGGGAGPVQLPTEPREGYEVVVTQAVWRGGGLLREQKILSYYPPYPRPEAAGQAGEG